MSEAFQEGIELLLHCHSPECRLVMEASSEEKPHFLKQKVWSQEVQQRVDLLIFTTLKKE